AVVRPATSRVRRLSSLDHVGAVGETLVLVRSIQRWPGGRCGESGAANLGTVAIEMSPYLPPPAAPRAQRRDVGEEREGRGGTGGWSSHRAFLLVLLAALVTMVALPSAARFDGKSRDDISRCRAESARLGFGNMGACVKYLAHGGTLGTTPTFEQICEGSQGQFAASGVVNSTAVAPLCEWSVPPGH